MKVTEFSSLYSKEASAVIDASEWVEAIRNGKYKSLVEQIRALVEQGRKDDASALKLKLPAVVYAGVCRMGRFFKDTTERTGWVMLDIDNKNPEQLKAAKELLEVFPWVVILHVTASGRGLRIVVNIGLVHIDVYRNAYECVAARLKELTGMDLDMACKDFARASLASYDPDIYFNPDATVFDYDEDYNPLNYVPASGPDTSEDFRVLNSPVTQALNLGYESEKNSSSAPNVAHILDRFFAKYTYVRGSRHTTMLFLGKYLRWHKVQSWQLDEAISLACSRGVESGITAKEIANAVKWGYEKGEEGGNNQTNWGHWGHNYNMNPFSPVKENEDSDNEEFTEDEKDEEEIIEDHCPSFDDRIMDNLPDEIKKLLTIAKDSKERDITLLGIIAISSTMFPALRTIYGNKKVSAHLYTFVVAGAGAGKGGAMNAVILAQKTDREFDRVYMKSKKEYERKLIEWEMELRIALKEHRMPDMEKKPEEPLRQSLITTPNTSKSQMIIDVKNAGEEGLCIISSEGDAMTEAMRTDYGNHAAELRMFFHHEEVRQRFKVDKEPIVIPHPRVAILLTGTPDQVVSLIRTTENGLFSRFLFYMMNDNPVWKSQSPLKGKGNIDVEELYGDLAEKLKVNFFNIRGKEIMINFTSDQWDMHDMIFDTELGIVSAEGKKNSEAIVKRYGLITMRIAMILSGYRIMEAGWQITEYTCQDDDFNTALHIVLTCIKHANHVSTMMKDMEIRSKVSNFYRLLPILEKMPDVFRFSDFRKAVEAEGFNATAAKRSLKKYVASGLLTKDNGFYKKTGKLKRRSI